MSQVLEQIKSRRSIRKYKPDEVPQELLEEMLWYFRAEDGR